MTDLALAREKQQLFEEWLRMEEKKLKIDLTVTVGIPGLNKEGVSGLNKDDGVEECGL